MSDMPGARAQRVRRTLATSPASITAWSAALLARPRVVLGVLTSVFAVATLAALLVSPHAALTSDESLYISEAMNIAKGMGPRYTSHAWIQHRPFLFPGLLALPMRLTGDVSSVYWLPRAAVLCNAFVVALLARRLHGQTAALFAALLVLPNAFLSSMGLSVYLDGAETFFLLLTLLCLWRGYDWRSSGWWAVGGIALGLAFLTKEAALLWLPLPLIFALLTLSPRDVRWAARALAAWAAAFAAIAAWWWPYAFAVDRRIYMWPGSFLSLAMVAMSIAAAGVAGVLLYRQISHSGATAALRMLRVTGVLVTLAWIAAFIVVMESASWPHAMHLESTVPAYLRSTVAGNASPWPLTACAVVWLGFRTRRSPELRLLALAFALWFPFAIFVADRGLALRDLLPMIYIVYVVAGVLLADLTAWLLREGGRVSGRLAAALVVVALVASGIAGERRLYRDAARPDAGGWDNPLVHRTAAWLDAHVEAGTPIMSSRLYFSQIYTLTDARFPISQLPTVNVVPAPGSDVFLHPRSTLFRWEDADLGPPRADARWLTVDEFAPKGYFTALSETDLLVGIEQRRIDYLIITGDDVAFSSTRYLDYFQANPTFVLVHQDRSESASLYVFRVQRDRLMHQDWPTVIPASVLNDLYAGHAGHMTPSQFVRAINPLGVVARPSAGLDADLVPVTVPGD